MSAQIAANCWGTLMEHDGAGVVPDGGLSPRRYWPLTGTFETKWELVGEGTNASATIGCCKRPRAASTLSANFGGILFGVGSPSQAAVHS